MALASRGSMMQIRRAFRKHPVRGNGPSPTGLFKNIEPDFLARRWRTNGRNEEGRLWRRFQGGCPNSPIWMFPNAKHALCLRNGGQSCPTPSIAYGGGI